MEDLMAQHSALKQDYKFSQEAFARISDIQPISSSNAGSLEKMKTVYSIEINKLEIEVRNFKQQFSKKSKECEQLQKENDLMSKLAQRCEGLERDTELWMRERDSMSAKYKTDLEYERAKFMAEKELALTSLNHQLEEFKIFGVSRQGEIEKLIIRLEQLELTQSNGNELIEEAHKRYKLQIKTLEKEASAAEKRFQAYYSEL